jgi:hypothetical protein
MRMDVDTTHIEMANIGYVSGPAVRAQDADFLLQGPNDETSNDLQDLAHHMYLITLGGRLHLAPIVNPHNILDLGTGTGIWAM